MKRPSPGSNFDLIQTYPKRAYTTPDIPPKNGPVTKYSDKFENLRYENKIEIKGEPFLFNLTSEIMQPIHVEYDV